MSIHPTSQEIMDRLDDVGSRFFSVSFVKKDGTPRLLSCNKATMAQFVKGNERGERMMIARKANNPQQITLLDQAEYKRLIDAGIPKEKAGPMSFRTVDTDAVYETKINGQKQIWRKFRAYVMPL